GGHGGSLKRLALRHDRRPRTQPAAVDFVERHMHCPFPCSAPGLEVLSRRPAPSPWPSPASGARGIEVPSPSEKERARVRGGPYRSTSRRNVTVSLRSPRSSVVRGGVVLATTRPRDTTTVRTANVLTASTTVGASNTTRLAGPPSLRP